MSRFNIHEAKTRFSELVRQAMLGEEVIIARDDKPIDATPEDFKGCV